LAQRLQSLSEALIEYFTREHMHLITPRDQRRSQELPISEMRRDGEHTLPLGQRFIQVLETFELHEPSKIALRRARQAKEVDEIAGEVLKHPPPHGPAVRRSEAIAPSDLEVLDDSFS